MRGSSPSETCLRAGVMAFTIAQKHGYYQQLPPNCNTGFQTKIAEYKKDKSTIFSPVWIWFSKTDSGATCNICKTSMPQKNGSTGNMINHLKRHHGFTRKPNAWRDFEELSSLKDERLQKKRKPESREEQPKHR